MNRLIIIEGTDGSGKETQTRLLYDKISKKDKCVKISFPDYNSDSSALVKMYLSGKFGPNPSDVNAYAASAFYGMDRYASYTMNWKEAYLNGEIIISDRYTISNMIHQGSKIADQEELKKYLDWLEDFEYNKIAIPRPSIVIFLNVDIEYTFKMMEERKNKMSGQEEKDIHEANKEYLKNTYNHALRLAKEKNWEVIDCIKDGKLLDKEIIHNEILYRLKKEGIYEV